MKSASAAVIELRERVSSPATSVVRLQEIARIADVSEARVAELGQITIAPAPPAGRTLRLSFDEVRQRLISRGVNLADVEFRGSSQITVSTPAEIATKPTEQRPASLPAAKPALRPVPPPRPVTLVEREQVEERLVAAFHQSYRPSESATAGLQVKFEFDAEAVPQLARVPASQLRFLETDIRQGGPQPLTVAWTSAQGEPQTLPVQAWVTPTPQILAVKHPVPKGYVLQPADLTWIAAKEDAGGLNTLAEVVGKEVVRNLRPGQPLQSQDLRTVPLVRSNDIVTVMVRRQGITVRRPFKALSAGALHDSVMLVAVDDPRLRIQAMVTGYHEAALIDTPRVTTTDIGDSYQRPVRVITDPDAEAGGRR